MSFFRWYNDGHRHSRIGMMTPAAMHYGRARELQVRRQAFFPATYAAQPERFPKGPPRRWKLPTAALINPPRLRSTTREALTNFRRNVSQSCGQVPSGRYFTAEWHAPWMWVRLTFETPNGTLNCPQA